MNRILAVAVLLFAFAQQLRAEGYLYPTGPGGGAAQSCPGCPPPQTDGSGGSGNVLPYGDPIIGFHRFLDSMFIKDWQQPIRTVRAWKAVVNPERNRIYMRLGGGMVAAYDATRFITRLEGREELIFGARRTLLGGGFEGYDRYLKPDQYFYAEQDQAGWFTPVIDGQNRLSGFDTDDRGNVYMAYQYFGWGIAKDDGKSDGSLMMNVVQMCNSDTNCKSAGRQYDKNANAVDVIVLKAGSRYYALTGTYTKSSLYDVTNAAAPIAVREFPWAIAQAAKIGSGSHLAVVNAGKLDIYTAEGLASGQGALRSLDFPGGAYVAVTSDGTRFYVAGTRGGKLVIDTVEVSGSSVTVANSTMFGSYYVATIQHHGGYLALTGGDSIGTDVLLFKVAGALPPQEVSLKRWVQGYYVKPPSAQYVTPRADQTDFKHATPLKLGNRLFVILSVFGLGDVIEIKSEDGITASRVGAHASGDVVYGDRVTFIAKTPAATPKSVTWNFDNAEGADANTSTRMTDQEIGHTYTGLTSATPVTRTVRANAGAGNESSVSVTLKPPTVKFGVVGTNYLFAQPNASSPAPIVVGDFFQDLSDGDAGGHVTTWTLDNVADVKGSGSTKSVGDCGAHSLSFTTQYGVLNNQLVANPYTVTIPVNYAVRPFAAAMTSPISDATTLTFTNASRPTGAAVIYQWNLVDANDQVIAAAPVGSASTYTVNKAQAVAGSRVRLKVTSLTAPTGACAGMTESIAYSQRLNPPDPRIKVTCASVSGDQPCSFTAESISGADVSTWTLNWSVAGGTVTGASTGTGLTFSPTFAQTTTYTITLTATNAIGTVPVAVPVQIKAPTCPQMTDHNVFITYAGPGCTSQAGNCGSGQFVFDVGSLQFTSAAYSFSCAPHTFAWTINGQSANTKDFTLTLSPGSYTASVVVNNGTQEKTLTKSFSVGGVVQPPTPNPPTPNPPTPNPPTGGCPTMNAFNVFVSYVGLSSGCRETNGVACQTGEQVALTVGGFGYNFGCATHSFAWSNGQAGQTASHSFGNAGTHPISVVVNNGAQQHTATANIVVTGGSTQPPTPNPPTPNPPTPNPPTPGSCPQMNGVNVFIQYADDANTCNQNNANGQCPLLAPIHFSAAAFNYNFGCATHTYTWDFNGVQKSGKNVQHTYAINGTYTVKLRVFNGSQTFDTETTVRVGGSTPVQGNVNVFIDKSILTGTIYQFTAKTDPANEIDRVTRFVWVFNNGVTQSTQDVNTKQAVYYDCGTRCANTTATVTLYAGSTPIGPPVTERIAPARRRGAGR